MEPPQVIFLVGPDMTGKTQIAQELASRLGYPYFKASTEHQTFLNGRDSFYEQVTWADPRMFDFLQQTGHRVVFDRGFPCEYAYSRVFNRLSPASVVRWLDESYAELGALVVICYRRSYDGITDDIDPSIGPETLMKIEDAYLEWSKSSRCRILWLSVDDEDLDREVNDIMKEIKSGE